jgi:antitoxin ParD1/3/4
MSKNTSILLGDYFEEFTHAQVKSGRFASVSEVVRAALRLFESQEMANKELVNELKIGEKSGVVENFNPVQFLDAIHKKHSLK